MALDDPLSAVILHDGEELCHRKFLLNQPNGGKLMCLSFNMGMFPSPIPCEFVTIS